MLSFCISGTYTDLYELTMGQAYFLAGRQDEPACFDYFFRKVPDAGGYVVFAGLHDLLTVLKDLRFTDEDIRYLQSLDLDHRFIEYLKSFRFRGTVHAAQEGELVFTNTPILRVEGNLVETQLIESLLLNILNFESLVATKASRMRQVAGNRALSDFGLRRAHGLGSVLAARAAFIGGFNSTSNTYAAQRYGIPAAGTMAHSFVQSYDSELEAFRAFARARPDDCIFLVDTYNTLKSGVPNAITVAHELESKGYRAKAIRLDSGDLAELAKAARSMLNEAGLAYMKIVTSNQLDEHVIKSLLDQKAPIDIFGVGTKLVTGHPDAALDGVYKLSMAAGKPRLKLSETSEKITLPGMKQLLRFANPDNGMLHGTDAIILAHENPAQIPAYHTLDSNETITIAGLAQQPLLEKVMENGKRVLPAPPLTELAAYARQQLERLPEKYKRYEGPATYRVVVSRELLRLRAGLIAQYQK